MTKIQEFESTTSAMQIAAYNFGGRNVVRVWGSSTDVARALFAKNEVSAPAIIHFQQDTEKEPTFWAARTFRSRNEALAFLFSQAIRFGLQKHTWIDEPAS